MVHNLLASAKVSLLLVFIAIGLGWGSGSFSNITATHEVASPLTGWISALVPVMFAYSGWNAAAYITEEIKNLSRNLPLALGLGTLSVIGDLPRAERAVPLCDARRRHRGPPSEEGGTLTDVVAEKLFGFVAGNVLAIFTIVSMAASISAMVLAGPRVYFAMARDHVFLESAERVSIRSTGPRFLRSPRRRCGQASWSSVETCLSSSATPVLRSCCSRAWP